MTNFIKTLQERGREFWDDSRDDGWTTYCEGERLDTLIADTIKATYQDLLDSGLLEEEQEECLGKERENCPWCARKMYCRDRKEQIAHNEAVRAVKDYIDKVKEV